MAVPPPMQPVNYYGLDPAAGPPPPRSGLAVASMVCGIVSLVGFCFWCVSIPLAITAVVMGGVARSQARRGTGGGRGMAIAGFACGIVTLAGWLFFGLAILFSQFR